MRKAISNWLTLPYRLWLLALGYHCWCNKCHTIVSGGFGYTDKNNNKKFMCVSCADKDYNIRKNIGRLKYGQSYDPTKGEFND